jgi:hypothetical protein
VGILLSQQIFPYYVFPHEDGQINETCSGRENKVEQLGGGGICCDDDNPVPLVLIVPLRDFFQFM